MKNELGTVQLDGPVEGRIPGIQRLSHQEMSGVGLSMTWLGQPP